MTDQPTVGDSPAPPPNLRVLPAAAEDEGRDWEAVYLLWGHDHGRNAAKTAKATGIPERTVQRRARAERWGERADREAAELAADARAGAKLKLHRAVTDAVDALARIARGEGETRTVLDKDGNRIEVTDPVPAQARVNAATAILDRVGLVGASKTILEAEPARRAGTMADRLADAPPEDMGVALLARLAVGS